jgi:hypothetical protein
MGQTGRPAWLTVAAPRLAAAGVVMPFWLFGLSTILGVTRAGYDFISDPISTLGGEGAPNAVVWQLGGFFVCAVLELAYAGALFAAFGRSFVAVLMVVIAGLLALSAAAPLGSTLTQVHMLAGLVLFACLALSPLAAAWEFRRRPEWGDLSRASLVVGLVLILWFLQEGSYEASRLGLWQRAFLIIALGWQVVVALRVRRLSRPHLELAPAT